MKLTKRTAVVMLPLKVDLGTMDRCDMIRAWAVAAHRQVRRDVRPLQKRLRMYRMEVWSSEYREAAEAYLDLTIGKANCRDNAVALGSFKS
eukprot:Skav205995  [mRNA]  locus=scaffold2084:225733:228408:- [translate_table: standard]